MATNRAGFSRLIAPGLRKVFDGELKQWPEEYSQIATVLTSKRAFEEELVVAGLGRFEQKQEGTPIIYDEPTQGNDRRYTHVSYGLGFRVTREMYDDDLYGVMKKMARELAISAKQTVELEFASLLDDAFTGATHQGADGLALCALNHPLTAGGTYSNTAAVSVDLGIGALRAASERHERLVNERGLPENRGRGSQIICSPTFQWVAEEILKSKQKAYTADNTMNAFDGMGLSHFVSHYMSDPDFWFLTTEKSMHDVKWFWRLKPEFENEDDFDTKDAKFSGYMRFSYGFTDWRGFDGSSGA